MAIDFDTNAAFSRENIPFYWWLIMEKEADKVEKDSTGLWWKRVRHSL